MERQPVIAAAAIGQAAVPRLISEWRIARRIRQLADRISDEYADRPLLMVGVLKGAWVFMADLVRQLSIPVRCDFVRISSYGMDTVSHGDPELLLDVGERIEDTDVLVVDDIIDTGISIAWLMEHFRRREPRSLRLCVLLDKRVRRQADIEADYVGFEIPDRFVVGYGIDYAEQHRELPYIGYV